MDRFSAGAIIARSFEIWRRNLAPFLLMTLVITLPAHALAFVVEDKRVTFGDTMTDRAIVQMLGGMLQLFASGAICWGVFQALVGKPIGFAESVAVGVRRLPLVLAVGVVAGLVTGIGFLLFILPGLVLMSVLYAAVPAAIIERTGVTASLTRSAQLTAGYRFGVFSVVALTFALTLGTALLVGSALPSSATWTAEVALSVVFGSFGAVTSTVTYHDLRRLKEGGAVDYDAFE